MNTTSCLKMTYFDLTLTRVHSTLDPGKFGVTTVVAEIYFLVIIINIIVFIKVWGHDSHNITPDNNLY